MKATGSSMVLLTWAGTDGQWRATPGARVGAAGRAAARARVAARADVEGLVLARSSETSTGFVGVYASGGGFGAELLEGTKRLRQDGYPSPVEAALERARWTKSLKRGKGHAPSATALASSGCSGQFVPGRSTLSAYRTSGTSPTTCSSTSARRSSSSRRAQGGGCAAPACACARMSLHACPHRHLALTRATWRRRAP